MDRTTFIPGPDPKLELAYSDVWLPGLYSRRVFVFQLPPTSSHEKAIAVLERALQALVEGTPELGGESVVVPAEEHDGQLPWRAIRAYKGIELVLKDGTAAAAGGSGFPSYTDLEQRGFPLAAFKDRELMPIPSGIAPEPQSVAKFQATLIDGGILLSTCLYHHLSDGNGMNAITRALGAACKRAAETPNSAVLPPVVLNTDRSAMRALNGGQTDLALHPAHSIMPGVYLPGAPHDEASAPVAAAPSADETANAPMAGGNGAEANAPAPLPTGFVPGFFRLTDAKAVQLKADASVHAACSTHDAISALLWRTLILARAALGRVSPADRTLFNFPHNARRHVGLPPDWVGNCVYFCLAETGVEAMAGSDDDGSAAEVLAQLAMQIRGCLNAVDHERVAGIMTLRRSDPYGLAWWPVGTPGEPRYVSITSFYQSGLLGIDWGAAWGPVKHFTTTDLGAMGDGFERVSFVGPKIGGGRGCDVLVGADDDELAFFRQDALWNRYFEPLPSEPLGR